MIKRLIGVALVGTFAAACGGTTSTDACKGRKAGDIIITELMIDPEGTDTGSEFIELYNTLGTAIDLKGMTINYKDTDGSGAKSHTIKAGNIPSQAYFAMGDVRSGPNPTWIGYSYGDGLGSMGNARGVVTLKCGTLTIDEFTYTQTAKPNRSRSLDPATPLNAMSNDTESNWCDTPANTIYFGNNAGTPGAANAACMPEAMAGTCVEGGSTRPIVTAGPGDLVITEIMANPKAASSTTGEWFEAYATRDFDLNDITIASPTSDTTLKSQACLPVKQGAYVLFARSGDPFVNGDLPAPAATYSLTLADTQSRLALYRGDAGIDDVAYLAAKDGISWQLNSNTLTVTANDDPNNFCLSRARWGTDGGGDYGSPGVANHDCPMVMNDGGMTDGGNDAGPMPNTNQCFDSALGANRDLVRPAVGDLVVTEFMADPKTAGTTQEWFEVLAKNTVDLNGITVKGNSGSATLTSSTCAQADAGSYLVFARSADTSVNGNVGPVVTTFTFALANSGGSIHVLGADGGALDDVTWTATVKSGISRQLDPGKLDNLMNDVETSFCHSDAGFFLADGGPSDVGTPGQPNRNCQ